MFPARRFDAQAPSLLKMAVEALSSLRAATASNQATMAASLPSSSSGSTGPSSASRIAALSCTQAPMQSSRASLLSPAPHEPKVVPQGRGREGRDQNGAEKLHHQIWRNVESGCCSALPKPEPTLHAELRDLIASGHQCHEDMALLQPLLGQGGIQEKAATHLGLGAAWRVRHRGSG